MEQRVENSILRGVAMNSGDLGTDHAIKRKLVALIQAKRQSSQKFSR